MFMNSASYASPVLPDFAGGCLTGLIPALVEGDTSPAWIAAEVLEAQQIILLVLDGLGWHQLQERTHITPTLSGLSGGAITTVAPSTTAAALTSITTGKPPGEHGLVGYRMPINGKILNTLRWSTGQGDAQKQIIPTEIQPCLTFGGQWPPVVTQKKFSHSGFTLAHMTNTRQVGYENRQGLVDGVVEQINNGEPFVYAYWDRIDQMGHEFGFGDQYCEELAACDKMITELINRLNPGVALLVTADHGQVEVGDRMLDLPPEVTKLIDGQSGEARFRWLHARLGSNQELYAAATEAFADVAWVVTAEQTVRQGWFGPQVTDAARSRLGDIALVARDPVGFRDAAEVMSIELIGRHGSLTAEEMLVPAISVVT